jgi:hypothetical protein
MRGRTIVAVALLAILVLFVGGLVIYSARALSRFERVEARRCTLLYAAPPHPDRFDAQSGETYYRKAFELAEPREMRPLVPLPPRPRQALPAHRPTRAGARAPHHRDDDVP